MKSKIALFSVLLLIFSILVPATVFAATDPGLENAIKATKQLFDIPDSLSNFSYSVRIEGDLKIWTLNWSSKDNDGTSIEVSIDNTGDVLSYYRYISNEIIKKLPALTESEAQKKAEEIIEKLNPNILDSIKILKRNRNVSINDNAYYFSFVRTHNGIVFPKNGIEISINKQTGELESYSKNWSKDLVFPSADKAITLEEAQKAFKKNLGLALTYKSSIENKNIKVYGAYSPIYNSYYYIDAFTGEKINLGSRYYDTAYGMTLKLGFSLEFSEVAFNEIVLTPEEIAAVEEVSNLLPQEEAEKIARELNILELDDSFTLSSARLYKGWFEKNGYEWNLNFTKSDEKNYSRVNVTIDASTGEITSFSTGFSMPDDDTVKYDKDTAKKAVEEFLNQIQPMKFKETKLEEREDEISTDEEIEKPKYYSFQYTRMVNGIPFEGNGITVEYNAVTGKIFGYNLEWYDVEFPSLEKAVSLDEIYNIFFRDIGLELQYTTAAPEIIFTMEKAENPKQEVKLVYAVKSDKPAILDAFTGTVLDYSGNPYKEEKPLEYTDIAGHYAQDEIEVLAQAGIGLEGPELKPDEKIKQKDFLLLISQIINNGYAFYGKLSLSDDNETDNLYQLLMQEGIIKESEINPDSPLTREDSVKFVIRALKYDKIAELSDIFNCTFKDKDEINPELIGHVVIAKGLNIVNGYGNYFRPKEELKKADALIIIYNYLQL
ncbi:YcdB/YcdC domain-containing protein [Acetivibrio clariflavus]|uniref:YcdB/YcdC domain-containing protein n=1 Tax=Acetivibrio clariflavus TaxID=288965 RepID=UPI000487F6BC|nr:YcdB/YcdC domain-containing protein [Acetivibrio clariflavus]